MIFNMIFNMPQRPTSLAAPLSRGIKHVSPVVLEPATYQPIKKKETVVANQKIALVSGYNQLSLG